MQDNHDLAGENTGAPRTPEQRHIKSNRERIGKLGETPEITEEMKDEIRTLIGEDGLRKFPHFDPNNLEAFWANDKPAYKLGDLKFDQYDGPKAWDSAWKGLKEWISAIKEMGFFNQ